MLITERHNRVEMGRKEKEHAISIKHVSRYTNENVIKPYSNWRGPVWINANTMLVYALVVSGRWRNKSRLDR